MICQKCVEEDVLHLDVTDWKPAREQAKRWWHDSGVPGHDPRRKAEPEERPETTAKPEEKPTTSAEPEKKPAAKAPQGLADLLGVADGRIRWGRGLAFLVALWLTNSVSFVVGGTPLLFVPPEVWLAVTVSDVLLVFIAFLVFLIVEDEVAAIGLTAIVYTAVAPMTRYLLQYDGGLEAFLEKLSELDFDERFDFLRSDIGIEPFIHSSIYVLVFLTGLRLALRKIRRPWVALLVGYAASGLALLAGWELVNRIREPEYPSMAFEGWLMAGLNVGVSAVLFATVISIGLRATRRRATAEPEKKPAPEKPTTTAEPEKKPAAVAGLADLLGVADGSVRWGRGLAFLLAAVMTHPLVNVVHGFPAKPPSDVELMQAVVSDVLLVLVALLVFRLVGAERAAVVVTAIAYAVVAPTAGFLLQIEIGFVEFVRVAGIEDFIRLLWLETGPVSFIQTFVFVLIFLGALGLSLRKIRWPWVALLLGYAAAGLIFQAGRELVPQLRESGPLPLEGWPMTAFIVLVAAIFATVISIGLRATRRTVVT